MTFIDIVLILIFFITVVLGFFQGTIKIVIALVSFYASVVLAGLYFQFLAAVFSKPAPPTAADNALSFFLVLIISFIVLLATGLYTFRYMKLPGRLDYLDRIAGTLLGFGLAVLAAGVISMVVHYTFVINDPASTATFPLTAMLQSSARGSMLRGLIIRDIVPAIYKLVAPFLPDSALIFFSFAGQR